MKKAVSIILSMVLILGVFTACSGSSEQNDDAEEFNITVDTHYAEVDESSVRAYEKLCRAVIAGETEVKFNTSLINDVNRLFYTCFPLYSLVEVINITEDSSGVTITYKNSTEEHLSLVSQFFDKVEEIKSACGYGEVGTDRYIFNLYTYFTENVQIDNSVLTSFDTVMQGRGYSSAICSAFEYLVLQGGGKASHIINSAGAQNAVSLVEFKGQWYYFNPALDIEKNQGKALTGFAMNSGRAGTGEFYHTDETPAEEVTDDTFDSLKGSDSFEIDGNSVKVSCGGESFVIDF